MPFFAVRVKMRPTTTMDLRSGPILDFARILDYFDRSPFDYLALDAGGQSLRLQRAAPPVTLALPAPGLGTVVALPATALPKPGDRVVRGQPLFALRRLKTLIEVQAPHDGEIASIDVAAGQFVEFGQVLARVVPA